MRLTSKHGLWLALGFGALSVGLMACPAFPGDVCTDIPGVCGDGGNTGDGNNPGDAKNDVVIDAPPGCDLTKELKDSPACVDESVGVFVSPTGNDNNDGTKAKPVQTLTGALTKLGGKPRIYVCEGAYTDSATISVGVSVYGALKCDWTVGGAKPKITGSKPDYVVKVDNVSSAVMLTDVELYGKDGTTNGGESSIALFVNASTDVKLARVHLEAGIGSKGADGTLSPLAFPDAGALTGQNANAATGGVATSVNCSGGGSSVGGKGGNANGFINGESGQPALGGGDGGIGGNINGPCQMGIDGVSNKASDAGVGASSGSLMAAGWLPNNGTGGTPGQPGQGGGGGGGRDNGSQQGGGGGGGAGGCGGAAGGGGKGGGASIALASLSSTIVMTNCTLATKAAGNGGNGVGGQSGQAPGGLFGLPVAPGCTGGSGGAGGAGGAGGGGAGGVSVGVLYKGTKPTYGNDTMITPGSKGTGGTSPAGGPSNGSDGVAQPELQAL